MKRQIIPILIIVLSLSGCNCGKKETHYNTESKQQMENDSYIHRDNSTSVIIEEIESSRQVTDVSVCSEESENISFSGAGSEGETIPISDNSAYEETEDLLQDNISRDANEGELFAIP